MKCLRNFRYGLMFNGNIKINWDGLKNKKMKIKRETAKYELIHNFLQV